ncbi:hypothetical protein [Paenibacillus rhizolycopersici]|uniref:hypothetical protein n=1 Tax=Paenibacillus rhizolycopersici TaxID=2780073 RepID=UPI003D271DEB
MRCNCEYCSLRCVGGTMVVLHNDCFEVHPQTKLLGLKKVAEVIRIIQSINHLEYFLIDYGYIEKITNSFPYNSDQTSKIHLQSIIQNFTRISFKKDINQEYGISTYKETINYLADTYKGREIVIISLTNPTGYQKVEGQFFYFWNPFNNDDFTFKRHFIHSQKHTVWKGVNDYTFCPIEESELNCALTRAININDQVPYNNSNKLYSYHEKYQLIIENKKTSQLIKDITFQAFAGELTIKVIYVEYHGYQISFHGKLALIQAFKKMNLKVNNKISDSEDCFKANEINMFQDLNINKGILRQLI